MEPANQPRPPTATAAILERFCDPSFWRRLNPELAISARSGPEAAIALDDDQRRRLRDDVRHGRDFAVDGVFSRARLAPLELAIERLQAIKCPAVFVFVYDEPWQLCASASTIVETVLGGAQVLVPDFWAWRVASTPGSGSSDRRRGPRWLYAQTPARSVTVWIPLWDGSVRGWTHEVHRWGAREGRRRPQPVSGLACDFGLAENVGGPPLDPHVPPTLAARLALIGQQVLRRRATSPVSPQLLELAGRLAALG